MVEVINDSNQELINLFKIIKHYHEEICRLIGDKEGPLRYNELHFYYNVLIDDITNSNKYINKKLIEDTVEKIALQDKSIKSCPDPIERNLNILTDLYRRNHIKKEEIQDYVISFDGYSEYFDLLFNTENLKLTDIEILLYLREKEIEILMEDKKINQNVYKLLEKKFKDPQFEKYKDIYNKLYTKKY